MMNIQDRVRHIKMFLEESHPDEVVPVESLDVIYSGYKEFVKKKRPNAPIEDMNKFAKRLVKECPNVEIWDFDEGKVCIGIALKSLFEM